MTKSPNVVRHRAAVSRPRRETLNGHLSVNLWFTGLSGSGKSTLAHATEEYLHLLGCRTYVFDGDNVRHGLCGDLTFTREDRVENIRRVSEMVNLFLDAGVMSLTAFISPLHSDREMAKEIIGHENVVEIYCSAPLEVCEARDVKGLYKQARAGLIKGYTGVSSPYEKPKQPDLEIDTSTLSVRDSVRAILKYLREEGYLLK